MADKQTGIRVNVRAGDKSGLKDIEGEGKRVGGSLKGAIGGGLSEGLKGGKEAMRSLVSEAKGALNMISGHAATVGNRLAGTLKAPMKEAMSEGLKGMKEGASSLLSDVKGVVGTVAGLAGGFGFAEITRQSLEANAKLGDMAAGIRFAGGTAREAAAVQQQAQKSALAWAQDGMKVVDAFTAIRGETGSIEFARESIDTVAQASRGAHKSIEAMAAVSGTLNEKFGITAEELPDALADVIGLSEKGGVSFEDMASKLGLIGAYAKEAGLEGRAGFQQMIGLLNLADNANGNFKKGLTGVGALLEQLGSSDGKNKIGAALGLSGGALKGDALSQIEAIMKATKGQKGQLEKAFGGETLKLLVDMGKTYAAAFDATGGSVKEKSAAAVDALRSSLGDASKSAVTWADIQKEAAAEMQESPQKIATATELLRQAMQSEKMQAAIAKIIGKLPQFAEWIAKIAGWTVDNPGVAITGAIVASIGKAAVGEAVGSAVGNLFKAFPGASIGVGLLATAAIAAAEAIMEYEGKKKAQEEKYDKTQTLVAAANKELRQTGTLSPETLNDLARARAEFAAVEQVSTTGFAPLSYGSQIIGKYAGGMEGVAEAEAAQATYEKLGEEGLQSRVSDLDNIIERGLAARKAAAAAGTPAAGASPAGGAGAPPIDFAAMQAAVASGVGSKELRVRVTNPNDIGGGGGPTGGGGTTPGWKPR